MTPAAYVQAAAAVFADGGIRYRAKPEAGRSLKQLHKKIYTLSRQLGYEWGFKVFDGALWISPQRPPKQVRKLSQRGMRYDRL